MIKPGALKITFRIALILAISLLWVGSPAPGAFAAGGGYRSWGPKTCKSFLDLRFHYPEAPFIPVLPDKGDWYLTESGKPVKFRHRGPKTEHDQNNLLWLFGERNSFHFQNITMDGTWSLGAVPGDYVQGMYLKSPMLEMRDVDYILFLRSLFHGALGRLDGLNRPSWLQGKQVAYALHSEHGDGPGQTFWAIDGARFEKYKDELPERIRNIPEAFFQMFANNYRKRLKMSEENIARLTAISREVFKRSVLILTTKGSFLHYGSLADAEEHAAEELKIDAGIVVTYSRGPDEPFPLELFNNEKTDHHGQLAAEIGRFVVEKGSVKDLSAREFQAASVAMVGMGIQLAKGEADYKRVPIFLPLGWEVEYWREHNYEGNREAILFASAEHLSITNIGPSNGPMYELDYHQHMMLYIMAREIGQRLW